MEVIYIQVPPCWLDFFEIIHVFSHLARTISILKSSISFHPCFAKNHPVASVCALQGARLRLRLVGKKMATRSEVGSADVVADRIANIEKQKDGNFTTEVGRKNSGGWRHEIPWRVQKFHLANSEFEGGTNKKWWTEGMMRDDV